MKMIWLLHLIGGYVSFRAEGGFPERFLNLSAHRQITLWNTKREGISLYACCMARDYPRLRGIARKTGVRMRVTSRHGIPFWLNRYRARAGLVVGAAVYVLLLQLLSGYIWVVDVIGNETVSTDTIKQAVAACDVGVGDPVLGLDIPDIQLEALRRLPDLSWITVNMEGSIAHVVVSERKNPDDDRTPRQPANVKAAADGVIVSMEVYEGDALVQVGDAVGEGMLLVSGVRTTELGDYLTRAHAKIWARTSRELQVTVPLSEEVLSPTGKAISRSTWCLFGIEIPWYNSGELPSNYTVERREHLLNVDGLQLPVGWYTDYAYEQALQTRVYTEQQAEEMAWKQLMVLESDLASVAEIRSRRETSERVGDTWQITVSYDCVENIAVQDDILLPETE